MVISLTKRSRTHNASVCFVSMKFIGCQNSSSKVKLVTLVKGSLKAPFSIATSLRCRRGCYSFPWIAPLYLWSLPHNAIKQGGIKYHFWVFGMTQPGIEPWSLGPLVNTRTEMVRKKLMATDERQIVNWCYFSAHRLLCMHDCFRDCCLHHLLRISSHVSSCLFSSPLFCVSPPSCFRVSQNPSLHIYP